MKYINETVRIDKNQHVCEFKQITEEIEQCVVCKKIRKIRK
jgi:hypothetical protein